MAARPLGKTPEQTMDNPQTAPDAREGRDSGQVSVEYLIVGAMIFSAVASVTTVMLLTLRNAYIFLIDFFCSPVL
jgi:hypothetical protein